MPHSFIIPFLSFFLFIIMTTPILFFIHSLNSCPHSFLSLSFCYYLILYCGWYLVLFGYSCSHPAMAPLEISSLDLSGSPLVAGEIPFVLLSFTIYSGSLLVAVVTRLISPPCEVSCWFVCWCHGFPLLSTSLV